MSPSDKVINSATATVSSRQTGSSRQATGAAGLDSAVLERAGASLTREGADSWEIFGQHEREILITARGGSRVDVSLSETAGLGMRVLVDGRPGFAYAGSLLAHSVDGACALAVEAARLMEPDPHIFFAGALPPRAALATFDEALATTPLAEQIERVRDNAACAATQAQVEALHLEYSTYEERLLTSHGAAYVYRATPMAFEVSMLAGPADERASGWSYGSGFTLASCDLAALVSEAAQTARALVGAAAVPSGSYNVLLAPAVTVTLLEVLGEALSGREALAGRSVLGEMVGRSIGSEALDITDDPFDLRGLGASRFDAEGTPRRENAIVRAGVLQTLLYERASASRAGVEPTGSAERGYRGQPLPDTTTLRLERGERAARALFGDLGNGLYIVSTSDVDIDQASGELSAGATGFVVRNGVIAEPVSGIVLGGALRSVLDGIVLVGDDLRYFGGYGAPSVLVEDVAVAGD